MSSDLDQLLRELADPDEVLGEHDRYTLLLAERLSAEERATFVGKLVDAAASGERRAVLTLGLLRAVEGRRVLFTLAAQRDRLGRLARHALVMLGDGPSFVREIAGDALDQTESFYRGDAVHDLGKIPGPIARAALMQALDDRNERVRCAAWEALVESHGLRPLLANPERRLTLSTELELFSVFLDRDLPAFVRLGAAELRRIFGWLDAGVPPAAIGIAWREHQAPELFDRVRKLLFVPEQPFPLDELAALKGVTRRWAEAMIAFRLEDHDPRVPDAMVRLDAAWTVPVLEEVASDSKTPATLREALARSIHALKPLTKPPWELALRSTTLVPIATYEQVLAKVVGAPARTESATLSGNPRDGYFGDLTLSAERASDRTRLSLRFTQTAWSESDSNPELELKGATLRAPHAPFAEKLALWHALRNALGCADDTLTASPAAIVDDADATTAQQLRAEITAALIAKAPSCDRVWLVSPRAHDLDAVLAAYSPALENVTLDDCGLRAIPARFSNVQYLSLARNPLDADALRGLALPQLTTLSLVGCPIRQLSREHLAGLPRLASLYLIDTKLEELDPGIVEACPLLRRVLLGNTPLARDAARRAALRERWKDVVWE